MKKQKIYSGGCASSLPVIVLSFVVPITVAIIPPAALASGDSGSTQYGDGVTVRKNADGTVDVSDDGGDGNCYTPVPAQPAVRVSKRPVHAKTGTISYSDGVTVKKNADGTVEVCDAPSYSNKVASLPARHGQTRHPVRGTSRFKDGVTVRRNSDGTVEVWDSSTYNR